MNKSDIEWCDFTSNPIRGKCLHACPYCYAERIRKRFKQPEKVSFILDELISIERRKKPAVIFIGSMHDIFGNWVEYGWIHRIIQTAGRAPQHTFLFLTKNPNRYLNFTFPDNCWLGTTITKKDKLLYYPGPRAFLSIEPLIENLGKIKFDVAGIIIGAMTGPGAIVPKREWANNIIFTNQHTPVFVKDNLLKIYPSSIPYLKQLPWAGEHA